MSYRFLERRQSGRYDEDWMKTRYIANPNLKSNIAKCHEKCVPDTAESLGTSGLPAGVGLMFVGLGEVREADINKLIHCCRQPESYQLDKDGDDQLHLPRRSVPTKLIPPAGERWNIG